MIIGLLGEVTLAESQLRPGDIDRLSSGTKERRDEASPTCLPSFVGLWRALWAAQASYREEERADRV